MLITCPFCGARPVAEFSYGGEDMRAAPAPTGQSPFLGMDATLEQTYLRTNPAGPHHELWYHGAACRLWFSLCRDTRTNQPQEDRS